MSGSGSDILYVGGIVGYAQTTVADSTNAGKIAEDICYAHRSVSDSGKREENAGWDAGIFLPPAYNGNAIGGITGYTHSDLLQCVNTGEVQHERKLSGSAADAVSAVSMAGGLAGGAVNGTISDSYNAGSISLTLTADDGTSGRGTEGSSTQNADKCAGFAGGLVGISGFQAVDENAALDTDKGERISYVHNFGQVSVDAPNAAAVSGKQAETSVGAGTLIGRCAYGTELNDAYGMEGVLSINGSVIGGSLSDGVLSDIGGNSSGGVSSGIGVSFSGGSLPGLDDGNIDESIEDTENVNEGAVGEGIEEALIGDRNGAVQISNVATASKEQFGMGEIAYLLDGAKEARNVWTQSGGPYPVLGTPHLAKVTTQQPSEGGSVSFRLEGMSTSYETFYAAPGAKVVIVVVPPSEGMTVYNDWTTSVESDAGTTYYRYNSYYGYALFGLSVIFGSGESVRLLDVEFGIDEGRTFEMPKEGDASVSSYFDYGYDTIVVDTWFVPKEEEVPVDPEPEVPEVKDHSSTGGKKPLAEKDEEKGTDPNSGDGTGGYNPNGNDEDRQPVLDAVVTLPNLTASDEPQNIQLPTESTAQLPAEASEAMPESQPEPESDPEPAADSEPDRAEVNEPEQAEQQKAPEEMTMFEVIQNTIKASPGLMLLLLLLLILLIVAGGYSRYRKNRRFK